MQTIKNFRKFMKDEQRFALKREQEVHNRLNAKPMQTKAYWIGRHDGLSHVFCESLSYQDVRYLHDFCRVEIECMEELDDGDSAENRGFINGIRIASGYLAGVIQDMGGNVHV